MRRRLPGHYKLRLRLWSSVLLGRICKPADEVSLIRPSLGNPKLLNHILQWVLSSDHINKETFLDPSLSNVWI